MKHQILGMTLGLTAILFFTGLALGGSYEKYGSEMQMEGSRAGTATMEQMGTPMLQTDQIREMQTLLQDKGYNVAEADGVIGPDTTEAIRQFQADEGLTATGTPDQTTLRALAPNAEQQEFFGLAPEFGENEGMMEQKEMETEPSKGHY